MAFNLFSKFSKKNQNSGPELTIVNSNTPFPIKEAFKTLYTDVLYLNIEDKSKKIAVTSSMPAEGKTTIATNLAITIAQNSEDKRVLLIDTDMRQPRISRLLGINKMTHGLSEFLAGIDDTPNFINVPQYRITVLSSGGTNKNPTKLIASKRMAELLKFCEQYFDYIIIDTPPVGVVSDALLLHDKINGYVLSVRADYSNINELDDTIERLKRVNAEIFGMVLTSLSMKSRKGKYGTKYFRYSSYSSEGNG